MDLLRHADSDGPRQISNLTAEVSAYKQKVKQLMQQRTQDERALHVLHEKFIKVDAERLKWQQVVQTSAGVVDKATLQSELITLQEKHRVILDNAEVLQFFLFRSLLTSFAFLSLLNLDATKTR